MSNDNRLSFRSNAFPANLDSATLHVCQAKLLLRRERATTRNPKERATINRLLAFCDEAIRTAANARGLR